MKQSILNWGLITMGEYFCNYGLRQNKTNVSETLPVQQHNYHVQLPLDSLKTHCGCSELSWFGLHVSITCLYFSETDNATAFCEINSEMHRFLSQMLRAASSGTFFRCMISHRRLWLQFRKCFLGWRLNYLRFTSEGVQMDRNGLGWWWVRDSRVTTVATERVGSCEREHGTTSNGREVRRPQLSLLVVYPSPSILFFLKLSFLFCKLAIINCCWNAVKIILNSMPSKHQSHGT